MSNYHYFKNYEFTNGVALTADLYTKKMYLTFSELEAADTLFGLGISHIYNNGSFSGEFGSGFNLNLNETFIRKDDDSLVFTDCFGIKYTQENGKFGSYKYEESVPEVISETNGYVHLSSLSNLERDLKFPLRWLSNDSVFKGFNSYGQLVLVADKNGNFYHFEYEVNGNMYSLFPKYIKQYKPSDSSGTTIYVVNYQSRKLVNITDASGNTLLSYAYGGNYLSSITIRGQEISFNYGPNGLSSVTTGNGIKIGINETGLTFTVKSLLSKIPDGATQSGQTISKLEFDYSNSSNITVKVKNQDGDYEKYNFRTDRLAYYYLYENGVFTAAEQYTETVNNSGTDDEQTIKTTTKANPATLYTSSESPIGFQNSEYVKTTYNKQKIALSREERTFAQNLSTFNYNTTEYTYDGGYLTSEKTTTKIYSANGTLARQYESYVNYTYENVSYRKRLLKSERYVQGENKEITLYEYELYASQYQTIPVKVTNYNDADSSLKVISNYDSFGRLTSQTDITGRTTVYTYVNGTQRISYVTYAGVWAGQYDYDNFGNPIEIAPSDTQHNDVTYASGETVKISDSLNYALNYTYNNKRRLSSIKYGNISTENYTYSETTTSETATLTNALSETFSIEATRNGLSETFKYNGNTQLVNSYNAKGWFIKQEDKVTSKTVSFTYDEVGRITNVTGSGVTEQYEYTADGGISKITYSGNYSQTISISYTGVTGNRISRIETADLIINPSYDALGRNTGKSVNRYASYITGETISYSNGLPSKIKYGTKEITYEYDTRGNISKITREGYVTTYEYDVYTNRLIRENNQKLNKTYIYRYDISGNRTAKYIFDYSTASTSSLINGGTGTKYSYAYSNGKLIYDGTSSNTYDECGNPTRYSGATAEWSKGLMTKCFGSTFEYDGSGRRIKKNNITYTYDSNGRLLKSSDGFEYFYDHTGVAGFKFYGTLYLYRKDIQGNIIAVLNSNGGVQFTYEYDAWGNFVAYDASGNKISTSGRTSPTSAEPTKLCDKNPFKYRGYFYDWQTGLYYLQSRYYDPSTGRFISVDSFEYADPGVTDGLNLYAYCKNNPVMYIDPTGHSLIGTILAIAGTLFVAGMINGVVNGFVDLASGGNFLGAFVGGFLSGMIATIGVSLAVVPGGLVGAGIAIFFGYGGGFVGSIVQQAIDNEGNIDFIVAAKSGAVTAVASLVSYGITNFMARNSYGVFDKVINKSLNLSTRIVESLSLNIGTFLLATYFSLINLADSLINKLI